MDKPYNPNKIDQVDKDPQAFGDIWKTDESENKCRICENPLTVFLPLGKVPISNALLTNEELNNPEFNEYKFDLKAGFCEKCKMVQITEFVPYEKYIISQEDGKTNYLFYSSTSEYMQKHFSDFAQEIKSKFLNNNDLVVEIGSNDGIMLQAFNQNEVRVLGVEPGHNVAEVARSKGVETLTEFFTEDLVRKIVEQKGKAKAVLSANVILNIGDLHELMRAVNLLLDEKGVFVFEDPYMPNILKNNAFDQFYDEHIYYFSITSLSNLMSMHNMEIFDVSEHPTHGGSMRIYVKRKSDLRPITDNVKRTLDFEDQIGLNSLETYKAFANRVKNLKKNLKDLLNKVKSENKKIVGYAATSKSSTALNYCDIGKDYLEYISDNTPDKQGKFSPGKHIPIVSPNKFHEDQPDYALLLAWNHAKEILEKEKPYRDKGGKFITYIPELKVI